jgi:hypothetical protein
MQLVLIIMMLFMWPYLLAAGMVLRAFTYTQRIGGLLIAIVVVSLLVYPTIIMFQYKTLSQNLPAVGPSVPLGSGALTLSSMSLCGKSLATGPINPDGTGTGAFAASGLGDHGISGIYCYTSATTLPASVIFKNQIPPDPYTSQTWVYGSGTGMVQSCQSIGNTASFDTPGQNCYLQKNISFYVFPKIEDIINLYSYWAPSLLSTEISISGHDVIPFKGSISALFSFFDSLLSRSFSGVGIPQDFADRIEPQYILNTYLAMENLYGLLGVPGFIIPILDLMLLVSATTGLSSILGGETSLLGLSRFL